MDKLDFLIIGAQKSATTALFRYLEPHPAIAMPRAKEAPLFVEDVAAADIDAFLETHFAHAAGKLRGKATPQYMCDLKAPARIHAHNPDVKLIAVLREPVERAWSHYRMVKRRNTESRSFDDAMSALLENDSLTRAREAKPPLHAEHYEPEGDFYLAWGEYGRILTSWRRYFDSDQLLVLFTSDLQRNPAYTLDRVLAFLHLSPGFRPDNLGEVVHKGGDATLIPDGFKAGLRDLAPVRLVWSLVPEARKQVLRYWYEQFNVRATAGGGPELSETTKHLLATHFQEDGARLEALIGEAPPWT